MSERKNSSWIAWGSIALLVVLISYLLSFGPACWLCSRSLTNRVVPRIYAPLGAVISHGPHSVSDAIYWYASIGLRRHIGVPILFDDRCVHAVFPDD